MLIFICEGDDINSLSQREAICFTGLGLEFSQPHPQSLQILFQLWLQIALIHPIIPSSSNCGEGNGTPLQCSCLENPMDAGAWSAAVYGVAQSRTRLKRLSSSSSSTLNKVAVLSFITQSLHQVMRAKLLMQLLTILKPHTFPADDSIFMEII